MLSSDKNVETLSQLIEMLKHNIGLRTEYVKLDVTARVVRLLGAATLAVLFAVIMVAVLFFASMAVVMWLAQFWGMPTAFAAAAAFYAIVLLLVYSCRKSWIERPLTRFLSNILLG
jgi:hypothetical protein